MAGELTAQFELELLDRMSGPLREVLDHVEGLNRVLTQFNGHGKTVTDTTDKLDGALQKSSSGAAAVSDALSKTNAVLGQTEAAGHEAGNGLHSVDASMADIEGQATSTLGSVERLSRTMMGLHESTNQERAGTEKFNEVLQESSSGAAAVSDALSKTNTVLGQTEGTSHEVEDGLRSVNDALTEVNDQASGTRGSVEQLSRTMTGLSESTAQESTEAARLDEALQDTSTGAKAVSDALSKTNTVLGETGGASHEAGNGLHSVETSLTGVEEQAKSTLSAVERLKNAMRDMHGDVGKKLHGFHENFNKAQSQGFNALVSGFELAEPVKEAAEYDNIIRHVGIGLEIHGDALDDYVLREKVKINELARETGQRSGALAEGLGFFSREGFRGDELDHLLSVTAKISTAYNAMPESVAKSAFALKENLGVDNKNLLGALASVAIAGKQADLPFEKLAPLLPQVAAAAGALGVKGRAGVNDLAAALAVVRKSTGTEGEAATDAKAFLQTITSTTGAKKWQKIFGEDIYDLEANARKHGQDPMMAVLERIRGLVAQVGDTNKALGMIFHNREDKEFTSGVLNHWDQYVTIHRLVESADQGVIDRDYNDGRKSTLIQVQEFEDATAQLMRRIGDDFAPTLHLVTQAINGVNKAFEWMDRVAPGLSPILVGTAGAFLGITTVLMALGAVTTAATAGFGILAAVIGAVSWPVVLVIAGITAVGVALYELYQHWDQVKVVMDHVGTAVVNFINKVLDAIPGALKDGWQWVKDTTNHVLHLPGSPPANNPEQNVPGILPPPPSANQDNNKVDPARHDPLGNVLNLNDFLMAKNQPSSLLPFPLPKIPTVPIPMPPSESRGQNKEGYGNHGATGKVLHLHKTRHIEQKSTFAVAPLPPAAPVVQPREERRLRVDIYADEGLKVHTNNGNDPSLETHTYSGHNGMMGRP
ncbi:phage tail tape measure protein [Saccharibacter sp. 17.LH.SD]|uniref:phage tail tape measure protein n=1 Tax=Saccharibacter sp. 17.LH.SD TaxID=2689393 RepID=UPI00136E7E8F|nr:phage tail tape measure protein [Saccharibacter sp. 17.LH.SD]MXV43904.1 phage tail tape measure protein [Saccharibacter sp. 17.LH.SD]